MGEVALAVLTLGAWVFAASAGGKLRDRRAYRAFVAGLRETGLVPGRALPATAALLASGEAAVAVSLAALAVATGVGGGPGVTPYARAALAVAVAMTGALTAGVTVTVRRGTRAPCACFGARSGRPLGHAHVARNTCLLAFLVTGLIAGSLAPEHLAPAAAALAAGSGSLAALMIIRWEDLTDLFSPAGLPAATGRPAGTTPRPAGTTPRPAGTTPRPAGTTPRPAGTTPRPAGTTPRPAGTTPRPAGTAERPTSGAGHGASRASA